MILEGLKFKKFASETFTHARDSILSKIDSSHNHILLVKFVNLVYEMIKYVLNRGLLLLRFLKTIHTYRKFKTFFFLLLVSFYRHKNIISRYVYTRVAYHTVVKTQN